MNCLRVKMCVTTATMKYSSDLVRWQSRVRQPSLFQVSRYDQIRQCYQTASDKGAYNVDLPIVWSRQCRVVITKAR